jgi:hypothetical protein
MTQQQVQVWMSVVISAVQGTAGSVLDNPAANAMAIADEIVEGFEARTQPGQVLVPTRKVPRDLRGTG